MVIVTGGGTGGHLYPGLAAARALVEAGQAVTYVGAQGGLEERVLPEAGLPFRIIPAGKLSREALRPGEGLKLLRGLWAAWRVVAELRPKAVLSMGGYAGFPAAFVAYLRGVPMVVHEQNAKLGLANRMLARMAKRVTLSTPIPLDGPLAGKTQVVGYPVREVRHAREGARGKLGLDLERLTVLVLGGSQGSKELNEQLPERLRPLLGEAQVLHQCGLRWEADLKAKITGPGWAHYHVQGYLDTGLAWAAADFAITRGGAGTLAESAFHRVPVLGVPLSADLDGGAQRANVAFYASAGAARLMTDWSEFGTHLGAMMDPSTREGMRSKLGGLSPQGAAGRLAQAVTEALA